MLHIVPVEVSKFQQVFLKQKPNKNIYLRMFRRFFNHFMGQSINTTSDVIPVTTNGSNLSYSINESLSWLTTIAPCFHLKGEQVKILTEPSIFYSTLMQYCLNSKSRIVLASLYLGTGKMEKALVTNIHNNVKNNPNLKVKILLDFTRGTRGEINSQTILKPLIKENNVNISFYHTPLLRGLIKKFAPNRWNELFGLQHMKIYLFDDIVIISGANLSKDYFTNRQDRYILIEDKQIANFYEELITKVEGISLIINDDTYIPHPTCKQLPYEGSKIEYIEKARKNISNFFFSTVKQQDISFNSESGDTWVFPLIEMGPFNIHHDSLITKKIFSNSVTGSFLNMTTGYFNLTEDLIKTMLNNSRASCNIIMAHPHSNGFFGASGPAGGIPDAYSLIAKSFYIKLVKSSQEKRFKLFEYERKNWTFHAKGLWYYLPDSSLPFLTLIGSSNYGERSVNRDLEAQICMVTKNKDLQKQLQNEVNNLFEKSSKAEKNLINRCTPFWVKVAVKIFKSFF